jgi:antitoxin VapB
VNEATAGRDPVEALRRRIRQPREREARLRLQPAASEDAAALGSLDSRLPEDRLADARLALQHERRVQRVAGDREQALRTFLEREVWPSLPPELLGSAPTAEEQDEILGYGRDGA